MSCKRKPVELTLRDLLPVGLTFVLTGLVLAYGGQIVGEQRKAVGADSCEARSDTYHGYNEGNNTCYDTAHSNPGNTTEVLGNGEFNATVGSLSSVVNLTGKLGTLATIMVAAVIIGVLVTAFSVRQ